MRLMRSVFLLAVTTCACLASLPARAGGGPEAGLRLVADSAAGKAHPARADSPFDWGDLAEMLSPPVKPEDTSDPILHLPLDDASGATTFADTSGFGYNGSCSGGTCPAAGQPGAMGTSVSFDGSDDSITVPHYGAFDFGTGTDFTVALWVKSSNPHVWASLVSNKSAWHWVTQGFIIAFWQDGKTWTANVGDGASEVHYEGGQIDDGQWHHLAVTFTRTGYMTLYQDGVQVNTGLMTSVGSVTSGQPLSIGSLWDGGSYCNYAGLMDDVRIYNHVLTAEEVSSLRFAPCTVTSAADSGPGTLREVLANPSCSPITFAGDYDIALSSPLLIRREVNVDATGRAVTVRATGYHRVLDISADKVTVYGLTIRNGYLIAPPSAGGTDYQGAGVFSHGTASNPNFQITLQNCSILNNYTALGFGGGVYTELVKLYLLGCTIASNSAPWYWGGGVDSVTGCAFLIDTTVANNTAGSGGGVMAEASDVLLSNCTIVGNEVTYDPTSGGAICKRNGVNHFLIRNTIAAGSRGGVNCGGVADIYLNANNLDDDGSCNPLFGNFSQTSNLLLGPLGNYGGITQTYPLLPGSAAIDAGTNDYTPTYDQRGLPRHVNQCDVGSFESQGFTLTKTGGDNQTASVNTPFCDPLAVAVTANLAVEPVNGGKVTFSPPGSGASAAITGSPATVSGGSASVTAAANSTPGSYGVGAGCSGAAGVSFTLTNAAAASPPPVGDGKNGTTGARFVKSGSVPAQIDVTYDATHCSAPKAVILYGNLGSWGGYAGCAQGDAGHLGSATIDGTGLTNVWFNILWTDGTTAGHPGYAYNGSSDVARTWDAAGLCAATADDKSHGTCP